VVAAADLDADSNLEERRNPIAIEAEGQTPESRDEIAA
jgi:hypothetical protein